MIKTFVLYVALEALLAALFAVVSVTRGMRVWAYWAFAGVFVLSLVLGIALLRGTRRRK